MRILWIAERFPPQRGGVAVSAARQVAGLAPRLDRLDLLHLSGDLCPGEIETSIPDSAAGAIVHRLGRPANDDEALRLLYETALSLGRKHRSEIVHGFFAVPAGYVAALAARALGIGSVVSLRGNDLERAMFHGPRLALLERTLSAAKAVSGVSKSLLEQVTILAGRREGLYWIPNGVDADFFSPGPPSPAALAAFERHPRPWIGFVGEARFKKGLPVLLETAARLTGRKNGTLFLVGAVRADERGAFETWRREVPQAASRLVEIPWLRSREALRDSYRVLDLVIMPSLWDGLPNALLEAMACACPVVAAATGGIVDVVESGKSGWLVPFEELGRFGVEVDRVLSLSTTDRESTGRAARSRVVAYFSMERERSETLELYRTLLEGPTRSEG